MLSLQLSQTTVIVAASYLLGCFTSGYYLVRWRTGQDIRTLGSGSVGARNVGRQIGPSGFTVTLLSDFAKGLIAVGLARWLAPDTSLYMFLALVAVVTGHIWPLQLKGRGGKGVATSVGGLLVFDWSLVVPLLLFCGIVAACTRRLTLACLGSYLLLPVIAYYRHYNVWEMTALAGFAGLILFAHRSNLWREIAGLRRSRGQESPTTPYE